MAKITMIFTVSVYTVLLSDCYHSWSLGNHMQKLTAVWRLEKVKLTSRSFKVITIFS